MRLGHSPRQDQGRTMIEYSHACTLLLRSDGGVKLHRASDLDRLCAVSCISLAMPPLPPALPPRLLDLRFSPDGAFVAGLVKRFAEIDVGQQLSGCWFDPLDEPLCPESAVVVWHVRDHHACVSRGGDDGCRGHHDLLPGTEAQADSSAAAQTGSCHHAMAAPISDLARAAPCAVCHLPPSEDDVAQLRVACARDGCTVCSQCPCAWSMCLHTVLGYSRPNQHNSLCSRA
jgi:hypothetical protein